jgi:esterase/lipase superfamily enzyme
MRPSRRLFLVVCSIATALRTTLPALLVAAPQPSAIKTERAKTDTTLDTTYYITNRERKAGRLGRAVGDSLEFGMIVTRFIEPAGLTTTGRLLANLKSLQTDSVRFSRTEFLNVLIAANARGSAVSDGTVLYVHGFATSFRRGVAQGAEIAHRGSFHGPMIVFAWPAHTALATWPSAYAIISRAYRQDSVVAAKSHDAFRAALEAVLDVTPAHSLTVVGHSLGAQLVAEALHGRSSVRDSLSATPLHALVFFAPDISADRFRDSLAAPMAAIAARRIVYASTADRMLTISRLINHSSRAGQAGGERALATSDLEIVDVANGRRAEGAFRALVDPKHAMRYASSALYDFFAVVRGAAAACRVYDPMIERTGANSWKLTRAPIPVTAPSCAAAAATPPRGEAR